MTAQIAVMAAVKTLQAAGIDDAVRDARRLLAHVLGVDPSRVTLVLHDPLTPAQVTAFEDLIARRAAREPVSHLTGLRQFYGRRFEVSADVLDPRPETEELIVAALQVPFRRVLDLGTGSGCLVTTLLAERGAGVAGIGTDLSQGALTIARHNAARLAVADRVQFFHGSWFDAVPPDQSPFDLIVSNPPYIAAHEMAGLAPEVRNFEPRMALTDEDDGLSCYRIIAAGAGAYLHKQGWLMLEIGPTQGDAVQGMMNSAGFTDVQCLPDMDGRDRVVQGQKPG